jgi:hypothetical protein
MISSTAKMRDDTLEGLLSSQTILVFGRKDASGIRLERSQLRSYFSGLLGFRSRECIASAAARTRNGGLPVAPKHFR